MSAQRANIGSVRPCRRRMLGSCWARAAMSGGIDPARAARLNLGKQAGRVSPRATTLGQPRHVPMVLSHRACRLQPRASPATGPTCYLGCAQWRDVATRPNLALELSAGWWRGRLRRRRASGSEARRTSFQQPLLVSAPAPSQRVVSMPLFGSNVIYQEQSAMEISMNSRRLPVAAKPQNR